MRFLARGLPLFVLLLLAGRAHAGGFVIIWGGGKTAAEGERALAEVQQPPWQQLIAAEAGYPRLEESSKVPGLKPGFFVVTLGACATQELAQQRADALRKRIAQRGGRQVPYVREVKDARPPACPRILDAPAPESCSDDASCQKACDSGDAPACDQLARSLAEAKPKGDVARIAALHLRGCDLESAWACARASDDAFLGRGTKKSAARRAELQARACELGDGTSCRAIGIDHRNAKRKEEALGFFEKACQLGNEDACRDAAEVAPSRASRQELQRLCESGDPAACAALARMFAQGNGGPKDPAQAARYDARACDLGEVNVCCRIGRACPQ